MITVFSNALKYLMVLALIGFQLSCSPAADEGSSGSNYDKPSVYFSSMINLNVNVFYEVGAEPYFGTTNGGLVYWDVLKQNLDALMQYKSQTTTVTVPADLSAATSIGAQGKSDWMATEILSLYSDIKSRSSNSQNAEFYVIFLNGYFNSGSGAETGVIGVSITGTPVIAIFKDVIEASSGTQAVRVFVEQSTLVHEMGHAMGFVNNGVPMVSNYQDSAHGAHSSNSNCVMYWLNEGASDLRNFVINYLTSNSPVMWGSEILADAQAFSL